MKKPNTKAITAFIVSHKEKRYEEIARLVKSKFGVTLTEDAIRSRLRRKGYSPLAGQFTLSHEENVKKEKQRLLNAQMRSQQTRDARVEARDRLLMETLKEAITPLEFLHKPPPSPKNTKDEETVCLIISDTHFGKKTDGYNLKIAEARFKHLCRTLSRIVAIHRMAYPIRHIHIFWTGDIVDGSSIYPTHAHHVDGHMVNQIFGIIPTIVNELSVFAREFETVTNHCIRGNHGRTSKIDHEETNWDNIVYKTMELATTNIKNMKWNIPLGWYQVVDVMGTKILQFHGHQIKMTMNIPWYGITTRVSRWALSQQVGHFDVAVQGHFHTSASFRWSSKRVFTNGTTGAGDEFALEFIGLESTETQWCFGIHPKRGVTWEYEINFK